MYSVVCCCFVFKKERIFEVWRINKIKQCNKTVTWFFESTIQKQWITNHDHSSVFEIGNYYEESNPILRLFLERWGQVNGCIIEELQYDTCWGSSEIDTSQSAQQNTNCNHAGFDSSPSPLTAQLDQKIYIYTMLYSLFQISNLKYFITSIKS